MSMLVEDSTLLKLSPALHNIVQSLPEDSSQNDYLITLIILILKEVDLHVKKPNDRGDFIPICHPKQWKNKGAYEIPLEHRKFPELNCRLVAIPVGDVVILNLTSVNQSIRTRCFAIDTLEYINIHSSDLSSRFMNIKHFSHKFKNTLTTPIRDEILNDMGIINPSLLGLPEEIQRKISKMLPEKSQNRSKVDEKWWE